MVPKLALQYQVRDVLLLICKSVIVVSEIMDPSSHSLRS